jgi:surface polysaccharide O-acyltransferase-like enzyme
MNDVPAKKRIFFLDELRALAIIFIMLVHISATWTQNLPLNENYVIALLFQIIGRSGVPLFLMITGTLLINKNYEISEFMKKRFTRVFAPLIFWSVIYFFIYFIRGNYHLIPTLYSGFTAAWYVWMLLGVYLFMPIINEFVKNKGIGGVEYFLGLFFIASFVYSLGIYNFNIFGPDLGYFLTPISYTILGYYLTNKEFKISNNKLVILGLLIFVSMCLSVAYLNVGGNYHFEGSYLSVFFIRGIVELNIFTILQASSIFLIIKYINSPETIGIFHKLSLLFKKRYPKKITSNISKYSYGMYLSHLPIIWFLFTNYGFFIKHSPLKWIPVLTIIVAIISFFIVWILNKIPYLKEVSGAH